MLKTTPNPSLTACADFDPKSIDRALAYHNCAHPESAVRRAVASASQALKRESREEALVRACSILEAAGATAYENADNLTGSNRKVAMGVVHLIEVVQQLLDSLLDEQPAGLVG